MNQQFLMLFRGGSQKYAKFTPQDIQKDQENWAKWLQSLAEKGHNPNGLAADRVNSGIQTSKGFTPGVFGQDDNVVSGYVVLEALDLAQASELAKNCPIISLEGNVEIRQLLPMAE